MASVSPEVQQELEGLVGRNFDEFNNGAFTKSQVSSWLDGQPLSADTKAIFLKISELTVTVGEHLIAIGRKVFAVLSSLVASFPNTSFGVVVGGLVSFLIGSIPVVGAILGPFLSPILLAFGLSMGAIADFQSVHLRDRMKAIENEFEVLRQ